ncbi:MAG: CHAT domain-containing protein [Phycisphaerales bacterium]
MNVHANLLTNLEPLDTSGRVALLRDNAVDQAEIDAILIALGDEAERLVVVEVARARVAAQLVTDLADRIGSACPRARARRALAQTLAYMGEHESALNVCAKAIEIARTAGEHIHEARARLASIHPLSELGRYAEARQAGLDAYAALNDADEHALAARADLNLGVVSRKANNPTQAVEHFQRAEPLLVNEPGILAQLKSNLGEALLDLDRLPEAERAFEDALEGFIALKHGWGAAIVEGNLADLALRQGQLARAISFFERARRHVELDQAPSHLARLLVELADVQLQIGMLDDAIVTYGEAMKMLKTLEQPAEDARANTGLGTAQLRRGKLDAAAASLNAAVHSWDGLGRWLDVARTELILAELDVLQGDRKAARARLQRAEHALAERPIDLAITRMRLAAVALEEGDSETAASTIAPALQLARAVGTAPLIADMLVIQGRIHRARNNLKAAASCFSEAVEHLERVRGTLHADRYRASFLSDRHAAYVELLKARLDDGSDTAAIFHAGELLKSRTLSELVRTVVDDPQAREAMTTPSHLLKTYQAAQMQLNALYQRFDLAGPSAAARLQELEGAVLRAEDRLRASADSSASARTLLARPMTLDEVQASLDKDMAIVNLLEVGDVLAAMIITHDEVHIVPEMCSVMQLADAVERARFQIGRGLRRVELSPERAQRLRSDCAAAIRAVAELLEPVFKRLEQSGCTRLVWVPAGALAHMPLAILPYKEQALFMSFELTTVLSTTLFFANVQHATRPSQRSHHAVVIGVSDDGAPLAAVEARSIAALLGENVTLLVDEQATAENVRTAVRNADLLHFAGHGRFEQQAPFASGLRLADRWFTLRDILQLDLSGAEVILSGCRTGLSASDRGGEHNGLIPAFLAAGAKTALVSMWEVDDAATTQFMNRFYKESVTGKNAAQALQATQGRLVADDVHPAHWAGFVISGRF